MLSLTVHSLIEGFALGAQQRSSQVHVVALAIAIVFHKDFAAFALGNAIKPVWGTRAFICLGTVFCLATPVGIELAILLERSINTFGTAMLGGFCAGTLMYVTSRELRDHLARPHQRDRRSACWYQAAVHLG